MTVCCVKLDIGRVCNVDKTVVVNIRKEERKTAQTQLAVFRSRRMELNQSRVLDIHDAVKVHVAEKVGSGSNGLGGLRIGRLLGGLLCGGRSGSGSLCGLLCGGRSGSGSLCGLRCGGRSGSGLRNRALCYLGSGNNNRSGNAGGGNELGAARVFP